MLNVAGGGFGTWAGLMPGKAGCCLVSVGAWRERRRAVCGGDFESGCQVGGRGGGEIGVFYCGRVGRSRVRGIDASGVRGSWDVGSLRWCALGVENDGVDTLLSSGCGSGRWGLMCVKCLKGGIDGNVTKWVVTEVDCGLGERLFCLGDGRCSI